MAHLLHIDASPRGERSQSRRLTREFVAQWQHAHPQDAVTYRDVGRQPIPHINEVWIAAAFTPPEQRSPDLQEAIALSDHLVDELLAADIYVLGVPMYNFGIPSALKAYIDHIIRIGRTFEFTPTDPDHPYTPLVLGKQMVIIAARGGSGFGRGGVYEKLNHQTSYLETIFRFIGITNITLIEVEYDETGGQPLADAIAQARRQIHDFIQHHSHPPVTQSRPPALPAS